MAPFTIAQLYSGDIREKFALAERIFHTDGPRLLADRAASETLARMDTAADELGCEMARLQYHILCRQCAARQGGCCCSAYMAGENDVIQLLMNFLAGGNPVIGPTDNAECCFIGPRGCILKYKPMFCLNYNCRHFLAATSESDLTVLYKAAGALLNEQYHLEQLLLKLLGR